MSEDANINPERADRLWDYLMNAGDSPKTALLVIVPALLVALVIGMYLFVGRQRGRKEIDKWLAETDMAEPPHRNGHTNE